LETLGHTGVTDENGVATVNFNVVGIPSDYSLRASFADTDFYAPSWSSRGFTITKQDTILKLQQPAAGDFDEDELLVATLTDFTGRGLWQRSVFFVITDGNQTFARAIQTDPIGRAVLGNIPLMPGDYTVKVSFSGQIDLGDNVIITLDDSYYNPAYVAGTLTINMVNAAPDCDGSYLWPDRIWPLDKSEKHITVNGIVDPDGDPTIITFLSIFQDEVVGVGPSSPDGDFNGARAWIRAERDGNGDGRVYHIEFVASDGNDSCTKTLRLATVAHDQSIDDIDIDAIDGRPLYDSTVPMKKPK
jgi:hypothetical protein